MKDIIYVSNAYDNIHADNRRMNFKSYIDNRNLDYLSKTGIECAVKYITFSTPTRESLDQVFALKSNISDVPVIRNDIHETILCTFSSNETFISNDSISIYFKKPLFFSTTIENLCEASFKLIDVSSNEELKPDDSQTTFKATVICICVRGRIMMEHQHFNVLLQSNNTTSKSLYQHNNNMAFRIHLPKRFNLNANWNVTLKSLHITNKINNIQKSEDYWFHIEAEEYEAGQQLNTPKILDARYSLPAGYFTSEIQILKILNSICTGNNLPINILVFSKNLKKYFLFNYTKNIDNSKMTKCTLSLSPMLARILGFISDINDGIVQHNFFPEGKRMKLKFQGQFPAAIWSGQPGQICIQCDLVEKMIVGSKLMRNLRCINIFEEKNNNVMSFSFDQNDFSHLAMKSFDSIEIRITNMDGEILTTDKQVTNMETIVHLMFTNI